MLEPTVALKHWTEQNMSQQSAALHVFSDANALHKKSQLQFRFDLDKTILVNFSSKFSKKNASLQTAICLV